MFFVVRGKKQMLFIKKNGPKHIFVGVVKSGLTQEVGQLKPSAGVTSSLSYLRKMFSVGHTAIKSDQRLLKALTLEEFWEVLGPNNGSFGVEGL